MKYIAVRTRADDPRLAACQDAMSSVCLRSRIVENIRNNAEYMRSFDVKPDRDGTATLWATFYNAQEDAALKRASEFFLEFWQKPMSPALSWRKTILLTSNACSAAQHVL